MGEEHLELLARYGELIRRLAESLKTDAMQFEPSRDAYSPLGLVYGFCADILSSMAQDALSSQRPDGLSLEDLFVSGAALAGRARVEGWAGLSHGDAASQPIEHSPEWAELMFDRLAHALDARTRSADANASARASARLFIAPASLTTASPPEGVAPVSAQEHFVTSDINLALPTGATAFPRSQIVSDRREGRFLASAEINGTWFAVAKVVLTTCTSQGKDAMITGVPDAVIDVLRLTCPELLVLR